MKKTDLRGMVFVFLSALLYGSYGVWSVLLGSEFGAFYQNYVRAGLVLLILVPACVFTNTWKKIELRQYKYFLLVSVFAAFTQVPLYYAYQHAGIGITSLLLFSCALLTAYVFGAVCLHERITFIKWTSLILAGLGLYFIFAHSLGAYSGLALCMAVLGGVAVGGQTSTSKLIPKRFSTLQTSTIIWSTSFVSSLVLSLAIGERQLIPALDVHWVSMLAFAIAGLLASYFVFEGFKHVEASVGGLIGLLEVVFGLVFGVMFFHESITLSMFIGAIIILIAAALPSIVVLEQKR